MFNRGNRKIEITAPPSELARQLQHPPPALLLHNGKVPVHRHTSQPTLIDEEEVTKSKRPVTERSRSIQYPLPYKEEKEKKKKKLSLFKKKKDKSHLEGDGSARYKVRTPESIGRKQVIYPGSAPLVRRPHSAASDRVEDKSFYRHGSQRNLKSADLGDEDDDIDNGHTGYPRFKTTRDSPELYRPRTRSTGGYDSLEKYGYITKPQPISQPDITSKDVVRTHSIPHRPAPPPPHRSVPPSSHRPIPPSPHRPVPPSPHRPVPPSPHRPAPTSPHQPSKNYKSSISPEMATPTVPGLIGIKNHGNTCFINIIVQCLGHTEQILHYILSGQCQKDVATLRKGKKKVPSILPGGGTSLSTWTQDDEILRPNTPGAITEYLAFLIKSLWNGQYEAKVSAVFKEVIGLWAEQYRGRNQHDAQEFLLWLLGILHDDINITSRISKVRIICN